LGVSATGIGRYEKRLQQRIPMVSKMLPDGYGAGYKDR
jgi:hypothetical protein